VDVPENLDDLPPEVEQCFYRVAQEAFENVARHAQASQLAVLLRPNNGGLELEISDDGAGFEPQDAANDQRLGIKGMRERAELIDARLDIKSKAGEGTSIHLKLEKIQ
jgi:two-component system nitrate/nitrite sensor histidine kinase NarX